jgi:hypothetical protein
MNGKRISGTREIISRTFRNGLILDVPQFEGGNKKSIEEVCEKFKESELNKYF